MKKIIFLVLGLGLLAAACNSQTAAPNPSSVPAKTPAPSSVTSLALINNSGSTNALPFAIRIFSDGSASALVQSNPGQDFKAGTIDTKNLLSLLQKAGDVSKLKEHCVKSVSFGTSTIITYNGKTSGDISCSTTGAAKDLYDFINQIEQQLKISANRLQSATPVK
ncbi:MAG: hypothetical protein WDN47_02565 [Candidatus Doudnabacteria bacterium]